MNTNRPAWLEHPRVFLPLLLGLVALTRIPLLLTGYGSDPDAWRVAYVARQLWGHGVYSVSRFPGNPLHEILMAPVIGPGGAFASNLITLIAFSGSVVLFFLWCRSTTPQAGLLTFAFAFTPLLWVNSASTMDYSFSLLLFLASILAVIRSRILLAGILMGLAIGFRPSNAVLLIVPLLLLPDDRPPRTRRSALLIAGTICAAALSFAPVWLEYGVTSWITLTTDQLGGIHISFVEKLMLAVYRSVYSIGPLAALAITAILFLNLSALRTTWRGRDRTLRAALAGLLALTIVFLALPVERAYLIPAIPLGLVVIGRIASRRSVLILAILLISFAFLNPDVVRHSGWRGTPGFHLREGMVLEELNKRAFMESKRAFLSSAPLPDSTVVIAGFDTQIWVENAAFVVERTNLDATRFPFMVRRKDSEALFVASVLTPERIEELRVAGLKVACTRDVLEYAMLVGKFEPGQVLVVDLP